MKVLQVTTNYPCPQNPIFGIFMKEQVESVEQFGVENTIFFSNGMKSNPKIKYSGTIVHLWSAVKLFFHLRRNKYDIIHCHNVLSGFILQLAGGLGKKNTILSLQIDPETKGSQDYKFTSMLYPKFARLIVKKQLKNPKEKFVYLPNGVNLDLFHPIDKTECKKRLGLDPDKCYILFVDSNTFKARTQKRKDRFNETMEILRTKYGHENLCELVMTKTPRAEVPFWMNACDLYLLTSDEEGSPNAVKECMACNIPVIATPVGNVPDLFEGVEECHMAKSFDSSELAALADKSLRNRRPVNTRSKIIEKGLDLDSIARRLYDLYESLAKSV